MNDTTISSTAGVVLREKIEALTAERDQLRAALEDLALTVEALHRRDQATATQMAEAAERLLDSLKNANRLIGRSHRAALGGVK